MDLPCGLGARWYLELQTDSNEPAWVELLMGEQHGDGLTVTAAGWLP